MSKKEALYSCFVFEPDKERKLEELHLTHRYFGDVGQADEDSAREKIELYFKWTKPPHTGFWEFRYLDLFDEGTVVVRNDFPAGHLLFDLRNELAKIGPPETRVWSPHVSIVRNGRKRFGSPLYMPVSLNLHFYGLYRGDRRVASWEFSK